MFCHQILPSLSGQYGSRKRWHHQPSRWQWQPVIVQAYGRRCDPGKMGWLGWSWRYGNHRVVLYIYNKYGWWKKSCTTCLWKKPLLKMGNLPAINWLAAFLPSTVLPLIWECFPRYIRKSLAIHKNDARHWRCLWTLGWWSLWRHNRAKLYLDIYIWMIYIQPNISEWRYGKYIYICK